MITITNGNDVIAGNGRRFEMRITNAAGTQFVIAQAEIVLPFSPGSLTYGAVSSASVKLRLENSPFIKGEVFKAYITPLKNGVKTTWIMLGEFKIVETKSVKSSNIAISDITAYDRLNFVDGKYAPTLTGKQTVKAIYKDLCDMIIANTKTYGFSSNLTYEEYIGRLSDEEIDVSLLSGYSIRNALGFLASYVGCNVVVNHSGRIIMKPFAKTDYDLFNSDRIATPTLAEHDTRIQFLLAKTSDDTKVTATTATTPQDGIIFTNPFATSNALKKVLAVETALTAYRTGTINQILGDPRLEPGDCIPLKGFEEDINIPIMQITLKFDGGLSAQIESYEPEENENLTMAEKIDFSLKASSDSSNYAETALDFSKKINAALGLYTIEVYDSMGAKTIYLSNAPELKDATYIATMTAEGFAFTEDWNDGEPVWTYGVDNKGTAVFKVLVANKITADMIDTATLNVEVSQLADFTIKTPIIYSEGSLNDDKTLKTYGVGLIKPQSRNYLTFYSGYNPIDPDSLSDEDKKLYKAEYKGTPLEYVKTASETLGRINFYVTSNGEMVAKNAEIEGKVSAVSSDGNNIVRVSGGVITLGAKKSTESDFSAFGRIFSEVNPYFTGSFDRYLRIYSDDVGVMISNNYNIESIDIEDSKSWLNSNYYLFYNEPNNDSEFSDISHMFVGNTAVTGGTLNASALNVSNSLKIAGKVHGNLTSTANIIAEGSLQSGGAFYSRGQYIMGYSSGSNVVIGNSKQGTVEEDGTVTGGSTNIYARTGKDVNFGNRACFFFGANMAANKFITIGNEEAFGYSTKTVTFDSGPITYTGLHTGIPGRNHYLTGTVLFPGGAVVSSDRRVKSEIQKFTAKHEEFFDNLIPRTFKYKDGTSDRTHFGFIAQELEEAITAAGLTTQDVAAFVETKDDKGNPEIKAIRYSEIIALNTHMIQKCLAKISLLEDEIKKLKEM